MPKSHMKLSDLLPMLDKQVQTAVVSAVKADSLEIEKVDVKRSVGSRKVLDLEEGSRTAVQYFSTRDLDRDGDIILPGGAVMDDFKLTGMPVFWNHDYTQPIGSDDKIKRDDMGWLAWTRYAKHEDPSARANLVWELKQQGHLRSNSIGFAILAYTRPEHDDFKAISDRMLKEWPEFTRKKLSELQRIITRYLVIEHSDVGVPANVNAQVIAVAKNYAPDEEIEKMFGVAVKGYPMGDPKKVCEHDYSAQWEVKDGVVVPKNARCSKCEEERPLTEDEVKWLGDIPKVEKAKTPSVVRRLPSVRKHIPSAKKLDILPSQQEIAAQVQREVKKTLDIAQGKV